MATDPDSIQPGEETGQSHPGASGDSPAGAANLSGTDGAPSGQSPDSTDEWTLDDATPPPPAAPPAASAPPAAGSGTSGEPADTPDANAGETGQQSDEQGDPPAKSETVRRALTRRDFATIAGVAAVLLIAAAGFVRALILGKPYSPPPPASVLPDLPMKGELVTLTGVETGWRPRKETDRVSLMEVILPSPTQVYPGLLPVIRVKIDPSASSSGFLKFIIRDDEQRITGDVRILGFSGGRFTGEGAGESPDTGSVYGTTGMFDRIAYFTYTASDRQRWYVEVSESSSQNAKEQEWRTLGTFEIRNRLFDE